MICLWLLLKVLKWARNMISAKPHRHQNSSLANTGIDKGKSLNTISRLDSFQPLILAIDWNLCLYDSDKSGTLEKYRQCLQIFHWHRLPTRRALNYSEVTFSNNSRTKTMAGHFRRLDSRPKITLILCVFVVSCIHYYVLCTLLIVIPFWNRLVFLQMSVCRQYERNATHRTQLSVRTNTPCTTWFMAIPNTAVMVGSLPVAFHPLFWPSSILVSIQQKCSCIGGAKELYETFLICIHMPLYWVLLPYDSEAEVYIFCGDRHTNDIHEFAAVNP